MSKLIKNQQKTRSESHNAVFVMNILIELSPISKFSLSLEAMKPFERKAQLWTHWRMPMRWFHVETNTRRQFSRTLWILLLCLINDENGLKAFGSCGYHSHDLNMLFKVLSLESYSCLRGFIPRISETSWVNICVFMLRAGFYECY